jgi:hypothetical protein
VNSDISKALFLQAFHIFEPVRSNPANQLKTNQLMQLTAKRGRGIENESISRQLARISTTGGHG